MRLLASVALALGLSLAAGCSRAEVPDFYGVRLGMVPRDVRDRFHAGAGTFTSEAAKDDYAIRWTKDPGAVASVDLATFEFHMGSLVAVRADLPASEAFAQGEPLVVTKSAVLARDRKGDAVHVDLLARDCPTHAAEAKKLAGQ